MRCLLAKCKSQPLTLNWSSISLLIHYPDFFLQWRVVNFEEFWSLLKKLTTSWRVADRTVLLQWRILSEQEVMGAVELLKSVCQVFQFVFLQNWLRLRCQRDLNHCGIIDMCRHTCHSHNKKLKHYLKVHLFP